MKNKLKTLKDIEMQYNPCHTSGEPVVCSVDDLRNMINEWINYIGLAEKIFVKRFKADERKWDKEYEQGQHRNYAHNLASEWLASVPIRFAKERAQVQILKKIFNKGGKNEKQT